MAQKDLTSLRSIIEWLKAEGELITVKDEVDPILEISGIQKKFENGPALLFDNIKGYPNARDIGNIFARRERVAKMLGVTDPKKLTFKAHDAIKNPIPHRVVKEAPCQEVVITEDIDVMATLPIIRHTEVDAGRLLGGHNVLIMGPPVQGGSHLSHNRMNFRGKDWASINFVPMSFMEEASFAYRGKKFPITLSIGTPPTVEMTAATGFLHTIVPLDGDELGIAGGLQGFPVEIVKAKTVDAYAIANSEWVVEGYIDNTVPRVWESDQAEKSQKLGEEPFFPEWPGYLGTAWLMRKFVATAITHRKDRPIFYTPLAHSIDVEMASTPLREACFYELAERIATGFVVDVTSIPGTAWGANIVYQVKKRGRRDEGLQRQLINHALSSHTALMLVFVVDDDVDIYSGDDLLYALTTRVNPSTGIIRGGGKVWGQVPSQYSLPPFYMTEGALGFDATIPFEIRGRFVRPQHPIDKVDLKKWFSDKQIADLQAGQSEYAKVLAETGW